MTATERTSMIQSLVATNEKVSVTELSHICNVTEETIRKDLTKLEKDGVLTRVHGGAIANNNAQTTSVHYNKRKDLNQKEKRCIGKHVKDILNGKRTVAIDSSSTVMEGLKMLPEGMDLTIVTHSTVIFQELNYEGIQIISAGGTYNPRTQSLQGILTKENLRKYNVDVALISCKAFDIKKGVQDSDESEAEIKKIMIEQAEKVCLLVDHTKFGKTSLVSILDIDKVDYVLTDQYPGADWEEYLAGKKIKLIYE